MAFRSILEIAGRTAGGVAIVALFFFGTLHVMDIYEARRIESITLRPPFQPIAESKFAFVAAPDGFNQLADTPTDPERSPFLLYEDDRKLGPSHSSYKSVVTIGNGRFLHWINNGFIFSASDNSDPNTNGRSYRLVRLR
jgi:hypothetical protein